MSVYIPEFILWGIAFYPVIGILLYVPLSAWQARFISGKHPIFDGLTVKRVLRMLGICALAWPVILGYNIHTEIDYRKKGYL